MIGNEILKIQNANIKGRQIRKNSESNDLDRITKDQNVLENIKLRGQNRYR